MIDSHCHLSDPRLRSQLPEVFARAAAAGVERIISIGTDLADAAATITLCTPLPHVRCAIGIHPNHSKAATVDEVERLGQLSQASCVVALGEMGLDYHRQDAPRDHQRLIFEAQLQLATKLDRPAVIHCREAVNDMLAVLKGFPGVRAVVHCFTGTVAEARRIIDAGYLLGFTGPITYKKSDELREAVKLTPLDRLLVETDAPYLSPEPVRKQKTNEPSFVVHTAAMIAKIKGVSVEEIDRITTANTLGFFRWK